MQATLNVIIMVSGVLVALLPVGIKALELIGTISRNTRVQTISSRAKIIVGALERANYASNYKGSEAVKQLLELANEWNINLTNDQAKQYIEDAVTNLRLEQSKQVE